MSIEKFEGGVAEKPKKSWGKEMAKIGMALLALYGGAEVFSDKKAMADDKSTRELLVSVMGEETVKGLEELRVLEDEIRKKVTAKRYDFSSEDINLLYKKYQGALEKTEGVDYFQSFFREALNRAEEGKIDRDVGANAINLVGRYFKDISEKEKDTRIKNSVERFSNKERITHDDVYDLRNSVFERYGEKN